MAINVTKLKQMLKQGQICRVYLFCGEEKYLRDMYLKQIKDLIVEKGMEDFNYEMFSGDLADFDVFSASVESYPQFSEKKLIVAKNTPFLKSAEFGKGVQKILDGLPGYCTIVFVEDETSKIKKSLISLIEEKGAVVSFDRQKPADLRSWVNRQLDKSGKKIRTSDAEYLIELCGCSLSALDAECGKLIAHAGDNEVITIDDINNMVNKNTEYKIYEMADKLLAKDAKGAYSLLQEFKINKEQPTVIIAAIYSQLSMLYMFKQLAYEKKDASGYLAPNRRFLARKIEANQKKYGSGELRQAMRLCAESDSAVKTGRMEAFTALEVIMAFILTHL